MIAFILFNWEL